MTMRARALSAIIAVSFCAAMLSSTRVHAQGPAAPSAAPASSAPPSDDKATELKKKGDALVADLKYAEAIAAYDASYAATPNPAVLFNKARALQGLGQFPEALAALQRFKKEAPADLLAKVPGLEAFISDMRARVTLVTIKCNTNGARVLVRDRVIGSTPFAEPIGINAGPAATVEVSADGFFPVKRQVDLPSGGNLVLDFTLVAKERGGVLTVRSTVTGAKIFVDGTAVGVSPAEAPLDAGSHAVRVHRDGYDDAQTTVVIAAGERKDITVDPTSSPGITSKWWFWTGVGVIVVGAVVTTIALTTEKSAGSGDFAPGKVSGPLVRF